MKETLNDTMNGKICLVTGATNGIGKATALALAQMGATVVIVGRNPAKSAAEVSEIKHISGNDAVEALIADLSIMSQVRHIADQFKAKYQQLHVLVNNAGGTFFKRQVTAEGFEKTFALNHLNSFLLTSLLLDTLKASAPARIVNVASDAHKGAQLDFDDLQSEKSRFSLTAYGRSKLATVVFSYELARRLSGTGVTANVLHPGLVRTGFASNLGAVPSAVFGFFLRFVGGLFFVLALAAFVVIPGVGLDTLPAMGAVLIALSLILGDVVLFTIGCIVGAVGLGLVIAAGSLTIHFFERVIHFIITPHSN